MARKPGRSSQSSTSEGVDVLIDIPVVKVDELDLKVEELRAQVAVNAQVRNLVQLSVGADVRLGKVDLKIEGVEAQALLKARLNNVEAILARVAMTLDRNPELLHSVGRAVEAVGGGAGHLLEKTGDAIKHIGEGAKDAAEDLGQGAGQAVGQLGHGTGRAVDEIGEGTNPALGEVGRVGGQGAAGLCRGAQQATSRPAKGGGQ